MWHDATGHSGWIDPREVKERQMVDIYTVGYLISKTRKEMRLLRSISSDGWGDLFIVPRPWIIKIRNL